VLKVLFGPFFDGNAELRLRSCQRTGMARISRQTVEASMFIGQLEQIVTTTARQISC